MQTVLEWLQPTLLALATFLLGAILRALSKAPAALLRFAEHLAAQARLTPGAGDDVVAAALLTIARALVDAIQRAPPPPPAPAPVELTMAIPTAPGLRQAPISGRSPPP